MGEWRGWEETGCRSLGTGLGEGEAARKEEKKGKISECCWAPSTFPRVVFTAIPVSWDPLFTDEEVKTKDEVPSPGHRTVGDRAGTYTRAAWAKLVLLLTPGYLVPPSKGKEQRPGELRWDLPPSEFCIRLPLPQSITWTSDARGSKNALMLTNSKLWLDLKFT